MIYSMIWESLRSCSGQLIQDVKAKNPKVRFLTEKEFKAALAPCIDAVRKRQVGILRNWNGCLIATALLINSSRLLCKDRDFGDTLTACLEKQKERARLQTFSDDYVFIIRARIS